VYSIDNRESFYEVKNLQAQIFETKAAESTASGGWRRRKPYVPMVVVGNKCELNRGSVGTLRAVETWELLKLADGRPSCGCLEASAKRNINIEEIFLKLFMLARLPTEMTPSLHRKVNSVNNALNYRIIPPACIRYRRGNKYDTQSTGLS
jgi:GTPase SAR1 family protein